MDDRLGVDLVRLRHLWDIPGERPRREVSVPKDKMERLRMRGARPEMEGGAQGSHDQRQPELQR